MNKMDFSVNRSPLKTIVPREVISFSDIIFGCERCCRMEIVSFFNKSSTSFLLQSKREKTSSIYTASIVLACMVLLCWIRFVSLSAI